MVDISAVHLVEMVIKDLTNTPYCVELHRAALFRKKLTMCVYLTGRGYLLSINAQRHDCNQRTERTIKAEFHLCLRSSGSTSVTLRALAASCL